MKTRNVEINYATTMTDDELARALKVRADHPVVRGVLEVLARLRLSYMRELTDPDLPEPTRLAAGTAIYTLQSVEGRLLGEIERANT